MIGGGCTLLKLAQSVDAIKDTLENDEQKVLLPSPLGGTNNLSSFSVFFLPSWYTGYVIASSSRPPLEGLRNMVADGLYPSLVVGRRFLVRPNGTAHSLVTAGLLEQRCQRALWLVAASCLFAAAGVHPCNCRPLLVLSHCTPEMPVPGFGRHMHLPMTPMGRGRVYGWRPPCGAGRFPGKGNRVSFWVTRQWAVTTSL